MKNTKIWDAMKQPPASALKTIKGGRLSGMTDISPQWRYQVMTEQFGPCGQGWKYEITEMWTEQGSNDQVFAFAKILLHYKMGDEWSEPIPGIGGSMLVAKEREGMHSSDEAFKMAVTDALSVAMKLLGVGADVYLGRWDGSKYTDEPESASTPTQGNSDTKTPPPPGKGSDKGSGDKQAQRAHDNRVRIGELLMQLAEGDESLAVEILEQETRWTNRDGKAMPGHQSIHKISDKATFPVMKKLEELHAARFGPPDQEEPAPEFKDEDIPF